MQLSTPQLMSIGAAVLLLIIAVSLFSAPLKFILKLVINTVVGLIGLFFLNLLGFLIGINLINGLVVGILGLPGLILLILIKLILL